MKDIKVYINEFDQEILEWPKEWLKEIFSWYSFWWVIFVYAVVCVIGLFL